MKKVPGGVTAGIEIIADSGYGGTRQGCVVNWCVYDDAIIYFSVFPFAIS